VPDWWVFIHFLLSSLSLSSPSRRHLHPYLLHVFPPPPSPPSPPSPSPLSPLSSRSPPSSIPSIYSLSISHRPSSSPPSISWLVSGYNSSLLHLLHLPYLLYFQLYSLYSLYFTFNFTPLLHLQLYTSTSPSTLHLSSLSPLSFIFSFATYSPSPSSHLSPSSNNTLDQISSITHSHYAISSVAQPS
jgi:hypothetical protein